MLRLSICLFFFSLSIMISVEGDKTYLIETGGKGRTARESEGGLDFQSRATGIGSIRDFDFCSNTRPCGVNQGDCDLDSHCRGRLKCGEDNCRKLHGYQADKDADCCYNPGSPGIGSSDDWAYCTSSDRCGEGEGDCDTDRDCRAGLICGDNNCRDIHGYQATKEADCCVRPVSEWNSWGRWSSCTRRCGGGTRSRRRGCNGYYCAGSSTDS